MTNIVDDLRMFGRFARHLGQFLQSPVAPEKCLALAARRVQQREEEFLSLIRRAVFDYPASPYLPLLRWAGVEFGDVARMVREDGIEAAMGRLYDADVYVSLAQAKGREPIRRRGLEYVTTAEGFDNPVQVRDFEVESGGSAGPRRRLAVDIDQIARDAPCRHAVHVANRVEEYPVGLWRAVPPGGAGLKNALEQAMISNPAHRWFTPYRSSWKPATFKSAVFTSYLVRAGRRHGNSIPEPEYVPLSDPSPIVRWLVEQVRAGRPAMLVAPASGAVRICALAQESGVDIAGTVFRVGGEPFTPAKARVVEQAGARSISAWAMSEAGGPIAGACGAREVIDEVHLYRGKIALLARNRTLSDGQEVDGALYLTTIETTSPKVMLNLETGDYGVLSQRRCGCRLESIGFADHLHSIRSYEKLTTGGMHFVGNEMAELVEEMLPRVFGGNPTDYQFVEYERDSTTRVALVVNSRLPGIDHDQVLERVLRALGQGTRGNQMMADSWQQGGTLHVVRREPYATPVGKILPLRILRGSGDFPQDDLNG